MDATELAGRLRERFQDLVEARGEVTVIVPPEDLLSCLTYLRDQPDLSLRFCSDVTASDWPDLHPRFWVAYHLMSIEHHHRVRVKVGLPAADPRVPSVTSLYPTAGWHEREVYDFFGVVFEGHPDLRRIEMPENWVGHPLRKDEPLGGVNTAYKGGPFIPPPDRRGL